MGADDRLSTMEVPLSNNLLEQWLGVTIRGTYQVASEHSRWTYETVSDLWPDIEPDSDSSDCVSSNEGSKDKSKSDYQEQKEVVLFPHRNPRNLKQDDQRSFKLSSKIPQLTWYI